MKPIATLLFLVYYMSFCTSNEKQLAANQHKTVLMEDDTLRHRKPAVAGTFYPANREKLAKTIEAHFASASVPGPIENIKAVIVPHAGYVYSGSVAASAFNQLNHDHIYDNIFLIGSSHHVSFNGAAIYTDGNFETPMGTANVNLELARDIVREHSDVFTDDPGAHTSEHSLEVQLPFLQYIYKEKLRIIPVIIASQNVSTVKRIANALSPYFQGNNLFVISTDFSHYPDYEDACTVDALTAKAIVRNSTSAFLSAIDQNAGKRIPNLATSICGWTSVLALLNITEHKPGIKYHEIVYRNSGDVEIGDKDRVVGYHAMAVTYADQELQDEDYLNEIERKTLLHIARITIEEYLETGKYHDAGSSTALTGKMLEPAGAFVTLTKEGKLRGCIGQFNADKPLYRMVQEMAVSSATRDYRFSHVNKNEIKALKIEISVLTPMKRIKSIDEIILGKHGIYIKKGSTSGTYLPQVAEQTDWNVEEFVSHCSRDKAGIGWDGWKDAELYTYEAYVFGEE